MLKNTIIILFAFFLISCEGPTGPAGKDGTNGVDGVNGINAGYDKQVRIYFNGGLTTSLHNWVFLQENANIIKFNKMNYTGVDSIIFVATLNGNVEAQLFNITDNHPIYNSIISANSTELVWRESPNIFIAFPKYEITVGIQMRVSSGTGVSSISSPMLILYRK